MNKNFLKNRIFRTSLVAMFVATLALFGWGCQDSSDDSSSDDSGTTAVGTKGRGGSGSANDATVSLKIHGSAPAAALLASEIPVIGKSGTQIGTLNISDARIMLHEIEFETEEAENEETIEGETDEEDNSIEFEGPYEVDLLTNTLNPEPVDSAIGSGIYDKIELDIQKLDASDADAMGILSNDPLIGNSIYVEGTYTPTTGSSVNFVMSYDLSEEFELVGTKGLTVEAGLTTNFVIAFRFADWFDFSSADENYDFDDLTAGAIDLNKDSVGNAEEVRNLIKENIESSADYGEDEDEDGELSENEDTDDDEEDED